MLSSYFIRHIFLPNIQFFFVRLLLFYTLPFQPSFLYYRILFFFFSILLFQERIFSILTFNFISMFASSHFFHFAPLKYFNTFWNKFIVSFLELFLILNCRTLYTICSQLSESNISHVKPVVLMHYG